MAIGVIKLSYEQRHNLYIVFLVLNGIEIVLSLLILVVAAYVYFRLAAVVYSEKSEVNFVFVIIAIFGSQVVLHYLGGIRVSYKCFHQAEKKSTRSVIFLWLCVCGMLLLELIILAYYTKQITHHINRSLIYSFKYGMQNYLIEAKWKRFIDNLQYRLSCCGIEDFEDWHKTRWLNKYHVSENTKLAKKFMNSDVKSYAVVPWSCCKIDFPLQCFHDPLQQTYSTQVYDKELSVILESINTEGCLELLQKPILLAVNVYVTLVAFIFLFSVVVLIVSRLLYTSSRHAMLLNDPKCLAPGWFFGRDDFGYKRGKTVYDIMKDDDNFVLTNKRVTHQVTDTETETEGETDSRL